MVMSCSAPGCKYQYRKGDGLKMHTFPRNEELRELWIAALNRKCFKPSSSSVVCSQHFKLECYEINVHRNIVLKKGSMPSIFFQSKNARPVMMPMCREEILSSNPSINDTSNECIKIEIVDEILGIANEPEINTSSVVEPNEPIINKIKIECETNELENDMHDCNEPETDSASDQNENKTLGNTNTKFHIPMVNRVCQYPIKRNRRHPHYVGDFIYEDLDDEVQRRKYWVMTHKVAETNRKKQKTTSKKIKTLERKVDTLKKVIQDLKSTYGDNKSKYTSKIIFTPNGQFVKS